MPNRILLTKVSQTDQTRFQKSQFPLRSNLNVPRSSCASHDRDVLAEKINSIFFLNFILN